MPVRVRVYMCVYVCVRWSCVGRVPGVGVFLLGNG